MLPATQCAHNIMGGRSQYNTGYSTSYSQWSGRHPPASPRLTQRQSTQVYSYLCDTIEGGVHASLRVLCQFVVAHTWLALYLNSISALCYYLLHLQCTYLYQLCTKFWSITRMRRHHYREARLQQAATIFNQISFMYDQISTVQVILMDGWLGWWSGKQCTAFLCAPALHPWVHPTLVFNLAFFILAFFLSFAFYILRANNNIWQYLSIS